MDHFVFAHITDPHLTRPDGASLRELANKRILGYLSWRRRRHAVHRREILEALISDLRSQAPDHVAITGDLTQIGLRSECRDARAWLESIGDARAVTVVPGNHDQYVRAPWNDTLGLWYDYMAPDQDTGAASGTDALFPSLRVRGPVAFIGLSSVYPCPPFLATGRVGKNQLSALARLLRQCRERGLVRVVLIHHPPIAGSYKWRKRLEDADQTTQLLREAGAELVLHGHTHKVMLNEVGTTTGPLRVLGLSSGSSSDSEPPRRARYMLYRVGGGEQGAAVEWSCRIYDPGQRRFRLECDWAGLETLGSTLPAT